MKSNLPPAAPSGPRNNHVTNVTVQLSAPALAKLDAMGKLIRSNRPVTLLAGLDVLEQYLMAAGTGGALAVVYPDGKVLRIGPEGEVTEAPKKTGEKSDSSSGPVTP